VPERKIDFCPLAPGVGPGAEGVVEVPPVVVVVVDPLVGVVVVDPVLVVVVCAWTHLMPGAAISAAISAARPAWRGQFVRGFRRGRRSIGLPY